MDAHALRKRGWTISAIARHLGHDRKTIRSYLEGGRVAGVRVAAGVSPFDPFVDYCREAVGRGPDLWSGHVFDEVVELGSTSRIRRSPASCVLRSLRPHCERCHAAKGRPVAIIDHPAGEETQWDWVDLPDPPAAWGWGANASLFVGALAHSGRWRGCLAESKDQPHTIDALDQITRKLGGLTRVWRFDRMATVCHPPTGRVTASFAGVAKHYAVQVAICPPRRGNRKGVVEKANDSAAQRWWRTLPTTPASNEAQASLDRFCVRVGDARQRVVNGERDTVAAHAAAERLMLPPAAFPATLTVERKVTAQALVAFRGNRYSTPPELAHDREGHMASGFAARRHHDRVGDRGRPSPPRRRRRRGDSARSRPRRRPRPGRHERVDQRATTPTQTTHPTRPGSAQAAAAVLTGTTTGGAASTVTDLTAYAKAAQGRNTLT